MLLKSAVSNPMGYPLVGTGFGGLDVNLSTCSSVHLSTCPLVRLSICPPEQLSIQTWGTKFEPLPRWRHTQKRTRCGHRRHCSCEIICFSQPTLPAPITVSIMFSRMHGSFKTTGFLQRTRCGNSRRSFPLGGDTCNT